MKSTFVTIVHLYYTTDMSSYTVSIDRAIENAAQHGKRVRVSRGGAFAVIVPEEDAIFLEAIENYIDVKEVKKRRTQSTNSKPVPWVKVKKKLGL